VIKDVDAVNIGTYVDNVNTDDPSDNPFGDRVGDIEGLALLTESQDVRPTQNGEPPWQSTKI
jgi:hypothetical protein